MRFSVVILKPDALEDNLEACIQERLEAEGIVVLCQKTLILDDVQVCQVYSDFVDKPYFPIIRCYLTVRPSSAWLVAFKGKNLERRLKSLKGHSCIPGTIRGDFPRKKWMDPEEFALWKQGVHPYQEQMLLEVVMKNRIHTADTRKMSKMFIKLFFAKEFLLEESQIFCEISSFIKA